MPAPLQKWKVLPHGALTVVAENIRTVVGDIQMPVGPLPRRMTVVRLKDGRLVIFSAIALDDDEMRALEDFGTPAYLVVPGDHHRLDAKIWMDRYPAMKVITPEGAREKVQEAIAVDATELNFGDPSVKFVAVPGTRAHEAALEVTSDDGLTLVLNDIVANIRGAHGFGGWLMGLMGFAGDAPQVPVPVKLSVIADKTALATQLRRWADDPALKRILVAHGEAIENDPAGRLRTLAAELDGT
jgi:hypothetical protein